MKQDEAVAAEMPVAVARKYICKGISAILLLTFLGCAMAPPKPVTIKHREEPNQGIAAVSREQKPKEVAAGSAADLAELLKRKNIISADEADRFIKQYGTKASGERDAAAASEGVAALVELLKRKNVVSTDEAARFMGQYGIPAAGVKIAASASEANDKEQLEKITASVSQEVKRGLQEQVKSQIQEEVAKEISKGDKERIAIITAGVTEELKKGLPEQVKNPAQDEVSRDAVKSDKEQAEKIKTSIAVELKKDLQEQVEIQVREEVPREIKKIELASAVPEWTKRIRFGGDIRLRYESDRFDKNNAVVARPDAPTQQMNTQTDQDRFRYRVRVGAAVQVNEQMEAVIRLATGNDSNPISTNSTMGDYMNRDRVYFDLAYLKWQPWKFLTLSGGRIPNPWFSSDLVWSSNLNFEGFALNVNKSVTESLTPFLTVGAFPLQQNDFSQQGKWLTAGQVGLEIKRPKGISAKIGTAYYNFSNITGVTNDPLSPGLTDWTAPLYQQKGNSLMCVTRDTSGVCTKTGLLSDFKELNITGTLDIGFWDPIHIVLLGDYVKNLGYDRQDIAQRTGLTDLGDEQTQGYQIGMSVGYPAIQAFGQWKVYLYYKYLEADAVVDAFTDSDFHLGGTNAKGWIFGFDFGLSKNFWLSTRWLTANEIGGLPMAIDVLQVDLNSKF